jgi:broad specificity phosphatase PhoE
VLSQPQLEDEDRDKDVVIANHGAHIGALRADMNRLSQHIDTLRQRNSILEDASTARVTYESFTRTLLCASSLVAGSSH